MKDRKEYLHGYHAGRKFNRSIRFYVLFAFVVGMLVQFLLCIILGLYK